jgi:L-lactate dehydrogenase complex protein LldF
METSTENFKENVSQAIADENLRAALSKLSEGFPAKRLEAVSRLPEFEALRDQARDIKSHVLQNLDFYLEKFEAQVIKSGGEVHWCRSAAEARSTILRISRDAGAQTITKSKSMIGEEIGINEHLEHHGIQPIETDLGEYIIQLRKERPSHIIAPAIHLSMEQVADTFRENHKHLASDRLLKDPQALLEEARDELRHKFLSADVGLTGANMLVAETGSIVLVSNEGNADLTYSLPKTHIAIASIEKIVPTLEDATTILRVLARSATGQDMSVYTTFCTGSKRPNDLDGPEKFHVVLIDNGRSKLLGGEFNDMLMCIRCGACLNHCPVYKAIGGHAYGWVYSGPMGAALMPGLIGIEKARHLPNASTLCGKCEAVCPVRIPLPSLLRSWRKREFEEQKKPTVGSRLLKSWSFLAMRPFLYRLIFATLIATLAFLGRNKGWFRRAPFFSGWTQHRDFPAPEGGTFVARWNRGERL